MAALTNLFIFLNKTCGIHQMLSLHGGFIDRQWHKYKHNQNYARVMFNEDKNDVKDIALNGGVGALGGFS